MAFFQKLYKSDNVFKIIPYFASVLYIYIYICGSIFRVVRVSANVIGVQILDASLINTQHCKVQIKSKWSNPGKGVASSPPP